MKIHLGLYLAVLLLAFGLRIHAITAPDLNIDEAWSFVRAEVVADMQEKPNARLVALAAEPNNALHLLVSSPFVACADSALGIRLVSALASLITVALTARVARRLMNSRAALFAALIAAFAFWPVYYAQIGRPYALETMLATASLLFWLERKWTKNLFCSLGAAFSHVGAAPVILVQDIFTIMQPVRRRGHQSFFWITNRLVVYAAVCGLVVLVLKRGADSGRPISAGQYLPGVGEFAVQTLSSLFGPMISSEPWYWLLVLSFALSILSALVWRTVRRCHVAPVGIPVLWILTSYAILALAVFLANGPIKFVHLTHVAIAVALVCGIVIAWLPKRAAQMLIILFIGLSSRALIQHYAHPYDMYSQTNRAIAQLRRGTERFYSEHITVLEALALNNPVSGALAIWPEDGTQPLTPYWYLNFDWGSAPLPPLPDECDSEPVQTIGQVRIHMCIVQ